MRSVILSAGQGRALPPLHDHQREAVEVCLEELRDDLRGHVEIPTGGGKTRIAAVLARRVFDINRYRTLFLAHRRELIQQQAAALVRWSGLPATIEMANLRFDDRAPIIVGSVQTLANPRAPGRLATILRRSPPGLLIVDECHHAACDGLYQSIFDRLSGIPAIGFSATPPLPGESPRPLLPRRLFHRTIKDLVDRKLLAPLRSERIEIPWNLRGIKTERGDYELSALVAAAETQWAVDVIAARTAAVLRERRGPAIAFAASVRHAHMLCRKFVEASLTAGVVWGTQPKEERAAAIQGWRAGLIQILCNFEILGEGIDLPAIATILLARPCRSERGYRQKIGRAARLSPGKEFGLIIECTAIERDPMQVTLDSMGLEDGLVALELPRKESDIRPAVVFGYPSKATVPPPSKTPRQIPLYEVRKIVSNFDNIKTLLKAEKQRRGIPQSKVIFLSMADVAGYWWCAWRSTLIARQHEYSMFQTYLIDRIKYAYHLGHKILPPQRADDVLSIGEHITLADVETFHIDACAMGDPEIPVNLPELDYERMQFMGKFEIGTYVDSVLTRQWPSFRWNFQWHDYVLTGVPDGLFADTVAELKTSAETWTAKRNLPRAQTQADLYGMFFEREFKREHFAIIKNNTIETEENTVDIEHAERTLAEFEAIETGRKLPIPPQEWKCSHCSYREGCSIRPQKETAPHTLVLPVPTKSTPPLAPEISRSQPLQLSFDFTDQA